MSQTVVSKQMFSKTMDKVESYISAVRMIKKGGSIATDQNHKFLSWFFTGRGLLTVWLLCTASSMIGVFCYYGCGVLAQASFRDWASLILVCMLTGLLLLSIVLQLAMLYDVAAAGMLLKMGFHHIKRDSRWLVVLERYLSKRPIDELERVKLFLESSPPYSIVSEPIKKSLVLLFMALASIVGFLFGAGKEQSLSNQLGPIMVNNLWVSFLSLGAIVGLFLAVVYYYNQCAQIYDQKTKRVLVVLGKLIESNNSAEKNSISNSKTK